MFLLQVSDKTEALVHSRLAARLLAKKNKELQQQLQALTDNSSDEVFQDACS